MISLTLYPDKVMGKVVCTSELIHVNQVALVKQQKTQTGLNLSDHEFKWQGLFTDVT